MDMLVGMAIKKLLNSTYSDSEETTKKYIQNFDFKTQ